MLVWLFFCWFREGGVGFGGSLYAVNGFKKGGVCFAVLFLIVLRVFVCCWFSVSSLVDFFCFE